MGLTFNYLLIPVLASFLITLFIVPKWIRRMREIGLVWDDMNKIKAEKVAGAGGLIAVLAFVFGTLLFIAYRTFFLGTHNYLVEILATLVVILLLAGIGLVDDVIGWKKGGLRKGARILLVLLAAIPLIVINAGRSQISLPFIGGLDLGIIYPLILIPIGIMGAATTFNFLAGFNGLEAGLGAIVLGGLAIVSYYTGSSWLSIIALCMVSSLLAFLLYNFCPAKAFPGDTLTYAVGGLIAIMAILGNFEKIAVFFFIPYILEFVLKSRGKLQKYSFGMPNKKGGLDLRYEKLYGLTHVSIYLLKKSGVEATEKRVVYLLWAFQAIIVVLGLIIFRGSIF